jgi:hypothetical protein
MMNWRGDDVKPFDGILKIGKAWNMDIRTLHPYPMPADYSLLVTDSLETQPQCKVHSRNGCLVAVIITIAHVFIG